MSRSDADDGGPGEGGAAERRIALLTVSYAGDLALCRRLCDSLDRVAPGTPHYLLVDRVDRDLFAPLATGARRLVETETYLPAFRQTRLFGRRLWLSPFTPPVRGWILQQLVKLAAVSTLTEDAVVLVDSDAVFLQAPPVERILRGGRTRLYRAPGAGDQPTHQAWHRVAARVLGLPRQDYFGADYITTAVTWRPAVVRALLARIAQSTRLPWRIALSWRFRFSEYILYGVFCDHVPGPHANTVFHDDRDLCHCSWHYDLAAQAGRDAFVADLQPDHAAVLIQSNLAMPEVERDALMAAVEARAATFDRAAPDPRTDAAQGA